MTPDFQAFPKITRLLDQDVVLTEKIDGTNAVVWISDDLSVVHAGSRNRWITPVDDNYGFAKFVRENETDLRKLGPGFHYGEWWGQGVQRGYSMTRKVFSLFNTHRWSDDAVRPACCDVVPVVYSGPLSHELLKNTRLEKSAAALRYGVDFGKPEGTMAYLTKAGVYLKNPHDKS